MENRGDVMEKHLTPYQSVITEIKNIISSGQEAAYSASSKAMLLTYWNIGKRIVEQELGGSERAAYGRNLISALAEDLTKEFGKNYSKRNLHYYIKFYQCFPDEQIVNACVHNLLIGKTLIKFDVIMQVSFGIIFTKLLCQILCQGRNQTSTVLCTFTATQFLLYNSFTYIPIGKQHCLTGSTIGSLLSRGNNAFNFCNN